MIALIIFLTAVFAVIALGALAAWSDWRGLIIPNIYPLAIGVSYAAAFILLNIFGHAEILPGLLSSIIAAFLFLALSFVLFSLNMVGAGDSKLGTVFSLWVGVGGLPAFLFYMTMIGALLGLFALLLQRKQLVRNPAPGGWIARVQGGENKVPYGVAITGGAFLTFCTLGYFHMSTILPFVN